MWLEAMYASMSIAGVCGVTLGINALFPAETKRFLRIVRAEITAKIPMKRKRPTVELALHAGVEVDIKWWDEEFDKLQRAIPDKGWARMVGSKIDAINAPTTAEITVGDVNRWLAHGVKEVAHGDFTFSVGGLIKTQERIAHEIEQFEAKPVEEEEEGCDSCEYQEVHTYTGKAAKRYRTLKCGDCQRKSAAIQPSPMWTPKADEEWLVF